MEVGTPRSSAHWGRWSASQSSGAKLWSQMQSIAHHEWYVVLLFLTRPAPVCSHSAAPYRTAPHRTASSDCYDVNPQGKPMLLRAAQELLHVASGPQCKDDAIVRCTLRCMTVSIMVEGIATHELRQMPEPRQGSPTLS